ncbi:MAG: DUF1572 family protein [Flavobacteriales bacterium]|nr:DUF1572 family protein [Flavobacteriales bacterium]
MLATLKEIFERDLQKLKEEIQLYKTEALLWEVKSEINNSGGNLALHICGNLKHFIGAVLGNSGFTRDRDAEFTDKNVSRTELYTLIDETSAVVIATLNNMDDKELARRFPIDVLRENMSTEFFLTHLATHLNYHLGQLTYHRRLIS